VSEHDPLDVLIAVYLVPDLAQQDFDAYVKLVEDKSIITEGIALVVKDADGEVHVQETGDHLGKKGAKVGGGVGLVIGLFAPPLLAATAVGAAAGAVAGKFARHRAEAGIGDKLDDALPPGSAGVVQTPDPAIAGWTWPMNQRQLVTIVYDPADPRTAAVAGQISGSPWHGAPTGNLISGALITVALVPLTWLTVRRIRAQRRESREGLFDAIG